jgi:hypothetical protein
LFLYPSFQTATAAQVSLITGSVLFVSSILFAVIILQKPPTAPQVKQPQCTLFVCVCVCTASRLLTLLHLFLYAFVCVPHVQYLASAFVLASIAIEQWIEHRDKKAAQDGLASKVAVP